MRTSDLTHGLATPTASSSLCTQYCILFRSSSLALPTKSSMWSYDTLHCWMCLQAESTRVDEADARLGVLMNDINLSGKYAHMAYILCRMQWYEQRVGQPLLHKG